MKKLTGKVAVITGGSSGIGLATAKLFVSEGAQVFIMGRRQQELDRAVAEIGGNVSGVRGDIAKSADLNHLYEVVSAQGRIDIVFANAGVGEFVPLEHITEEQFDRTFNVNVRGTLFTVQKALPLLNDGASIILTGSITSRHAIPSAGVYSASKAALRSLVRGWTLKLKERRIRSNVLSPGPIDTPTVAGLPAHLVPAHVTAHTVSSIPMGRMGTVAEVAKAALFLASDDSSFITGIELFVDGGTAQV